ncbi:hypothetical protein JCM10213_008717 [Rhodosporidiobolus nylandii]
MLLRAALPRRTAVLPPLARSTLPLPLPIVPTSRLFSSTPQAQQPRASRSVQKEESAATAKANEEDLKASGGGKIQTIPFQYPPSRGLEISSTAAHSAFGISHVARLLLARFFERFGLSREAFGGFFETGVRRIAFRAVLLPVWKVDLAMRGKALLDQAELSLNISALDASLPGFRLSPLDRLSVSPPFEVPPVPFSPSTHLNPFSSLPPSRAFPTPPSVTPIPFTRSPLNLLRKLSALPRTLPSSSDEEGGLSFDPKQFKPVLFAAYPLYVPVYLGEWELDELVQGEEERRRVTTVAFATVDGTAFAVYPQYLSPPQWLPSSSSIDLTISGRPSSSSDPSNLPSPESLKNLKPKLVEALDSLKERVLGEDDGEGVDSSGITEVVKVQAGEGGVEEWVKGQGRALGYSEWADHNRAYVEAVFEADNAEALKEQIENLPPTARPLLLTTSSLPKLSSRTDLLTSLQSALDKARAKVRALKPGWIEGAERSEREREEEERRERVRERGMRGRGRA